MRHVHITCSISLVYAITVLLFLRAEPTRPPFSCDSSGPSTSSYPFCNSSLPIAERVQDLVSRLTLEEKISQLVNSAAAIPRLNVSAYQWWSEGLHGVSRHGKGIRFNGTIRAATMFPQIILTAASFDQLLWYRIAQAIGREARAMYNAGQAMGLTYWAPNINILRDPRWGRSQETPGEDPMMVGKYGVAYVRGIQGDSFEGGSLKDSHLQVSACCKHFIAQDLDNWHNISRYIFDAKIGEQDMADSFQPPFKRCVEEGKASSIMCAYNLVNGIPNCADYDLLTKTAREQWGFQGYIASDCDAVQTIHDQQKYAKLPEDAAALVLKAGMDLNCGTYLSKYTKLALENKKVQESDIDRALKNLFSVRMRLGLFNGDPRKLEYGDITPEEVCSQKHLDLALEAARNGIVLLKNSGGILPLSKTETASLAVIGPNANASESLLGNYEGVPCKNITFLQALQSYVSNTMYHQGCDFVNCTTAAAANEAAKIAAVADNVVLIMGLDQTQEREKFDRTDLTLPGKQEYLISEMAKIAKKPVVLVLMSGGPIDISFAKENPKIGSIFWIGYPGEMGGIALAQTIFGDNNPGGKLPVTWYPQDFVKIPMTDMRMRPDNSSNYPGRTYRFYTGTKVYEFGYGLSYTNHLYKFISVSKSILHLLSLSSPASNVLVSDIHPEICSAETISAKVAVQNDGKLASKHPVLLFLRQDTHGKGDPIKSLVAFQTVRLNVGERIEMEFVLNPCEHFSKASKDGSMVIERGKYFLVVEDEEYPISLVL